MNQLSCAKPTLETLGIDLANSDRKQFRSPYLSLVGRYTTACGLHPFDVLNVELVQTANDIEMSSKPIFDIYP